MSGQVYQYEVLVPRAQPLQVRLLLQISPSGLGAGFRGIAGHQAKHLTISFYSQLYLVMCASSRSLCRGCCREVMYSKKRGSTSLAEARREMP